MHHHGRGVYSGTFSGTLNPALQDRSGRPKRDISTIVHILNDLLGAAPQYRRQALGRLASSGVSRLAEAPVQGKSEEEYSRLRKENSATRGKMEQLQLRLEERRARRRARREARAPYTWSANGKAAALQTGVDMNGIGASSRGDPEGDMEALESTGLNESNAAGEYLQLNPETVVV